MVASGRTIRSSQDPDLLTVAADITEPATAGRIVEAALDRFGRLDTLINNASVCIAKPFTGYTAADYAAVVGVSLTGFFWLTQRAIGEMAVRYGGHVVNVSATVAELADTGTPAVLAALAQGGLAAATRSLAIEYAALGIRVNAVSPGTRPDHASDRKLRRPQRPGSPARPRGPGRRRRGRRLVPGVLALHHRRDPAHRRRSDRRSQ